MSTISFFCVMSSSPLIPIFTEVTVQYINADSLWTDGDLTDYLRLSHQEKQTTSDAEVGKMTTFDLWPFDLGGGGHGVQAQMWHPDPR